MMLSLSKFATPSHLFRIKLLGRFLPQLQQKKNQIELKIKAFMKRQLMNSIIFSKRANKKVINIKFFRFFLENFFIHV